jgi:hypothetical protein
MGAEIMQILSYGEDAYTLWALRKRLTHVLSEFQDNSEVDKCKAIFRPSFGRRGGDGSAQFGEFDFIVLSQSHVYLGESKWDRSSELNGEKLFLREEQLKRHYILTAYIEKWFEKDFKHWTDFLNHAGEYLTLPQGRIKTAPVGSRLSENLFSLLEITKNHFHQNKPEIKNLLLYLYKETPLQSIPSSVNDDFQLIPLDYSEALFEDSHYMDINK